jgi:hypothetical protein
MGTDGLGHGFRAWAFAMMAFDDLRVSCDSRAIKALPGLDFGPAYGIGGGLVGRLDHD